MHAVKKKYHFYAAHRNVLLQDKCSNLHGHTYYVTVHIKFPPPGQDGVTMLFSDIDKVVEPIIKRFDHTTLLHIKDPLCIALTNFNVDHPEARTSFIPTEFPTSAENVAKYLCLQIAAELNVPPTAVLVELQETTSSTVVYTPDAESN